jgi:hypothetical protein
LESGLACTLGDESRELARCGISVILGRGRLAPDAAPRIEWDASLPELIG